MDIKRTPRWMTTLLSDFCRPQPPQRELTITEEQQKILEKADKFDRLISEAGWEEVLEFMAERVNDAIILASQSEDSRDVIRWNAKRSMLDDALAYIRDTRAERDRIREMQREMETVNG